MDVVRYYKLEIFIPETYFRALQKALQDADTGHIGNYDSCLAYSRVTGTWRPLAGTKPFIGTEGEVSEEPELKVEVTIRAEILDEVMKAIKAVHPYEEPLINVLPLVATGMEWK
ncbi:MAG: divalent cation tolerance protein CutA [Selenomonadaceae bacterium]|nr:divalent cation tolerance protein CutA [Selenomonadaceae bacterium]